MKEVQGVIAETLRKSDVTLAIHYALGHWPALLRYCGDGNLEIDIKGAERSLQAVGLGRNYPFAGSNKGGDRPTAIYSQIGSAKLNGDNREAYLSHVLSRIADHPIHRSSKLLPWIVASRPSTILKPITTYYLP